MRFWMMVTVMFVALALGGGCFGGGGGNGGSEDAMELIADLALIAGVDNGLDMGDGFKSPTAEPGNEQMHAAAMVLVKRRATRHPNVLAWVMEPLNFELVAAVARSARCPVCKGLLMAAGCTIHYIGPVEDGKSQYDRDIWLTRPDGTEWGKPTEEAQ